MRLWSKDLLPILPSMQLKGQWRECCLIAKALHDGNLNHILVNRVKDYPIDEFYHYSGLVAEEMTKIASVNDMKVLQYSPNLDCTTDYYLGFAHGYNIFKGWHNDRYLRQCLYNLEEKAICGGIPADEWQKIYDAYGERFDLWSGKEGE